MAEASENVKQVEESASSLFWEHTSGLVSDTHFKTAETHGAHLKKVSAAGLGGCRKHPSLPTIRAKEKAGVREGKMCRPFALEEKIV